MRPIIPPACQVPSKGMAGPRGGRRTVSVANVAVIGAQWGDEGKGKIVDWLAERADMVVRLQRYYKSDNTLVVCEQVYIL